MSDMRSEGLWWSSSFCVVYQGQLNQTVEEIEDLRDEEMRGLFS